MKTILQIMLLAGIVALFGNCTAPDATKNETSTAKTQNFDWLLGNWQRLKETDERETFEYWQKVDDSKYTGIGFTMQYGDTISQESMELIQRDGQWQFWVKIPEEPQAIKFDIRSFDEHSFTCHNDSNEFPKVIKYWKTDTALNASISGDGMEIPFEFKPMK